MSTNIYCRLALLLAIVVAQCASSAIAADRESKTITIKVLPDSEHCLIDRLDIACSDAASHLLKKLRTPLNHSIVVSNKGKTNRVIVDRTRRELMQAGFTDVTSVVAAFISEPPKK